MEDSWFMDDLLGEAYQDPVMAEDGYIYERSFIEEWFKKGGTKSPKTLLPIGRSLFYPFEYYQMRSVWAKERGMDEPKKPERYGLCSHPEPPSTPKPVLRIIPVIPMTVNYYYDSDDEIHEDHEEEYPPLPRASPPTRPPIVRPAPPTARARTGGTQQASPAMPHPP